jgi:hypothetical protein
MRLVKLAAVVAGVAVVGLAAAAFLVWSSAKTSTVGEPSCCRSCCSLGSAVDEVREGPVHIDWTGPHRFWVRAGDGDLEYRDRSLDRRAHATPYGRLGESPGTGTHASDRISNHTRVPDAVGVTPQRWAIRSTRNRPQPPDSPPLEGAWAGVKPVPGSTTSTRTRRGENRSSTRRYCSGPTSAWRTALFTSSATSRRTSPRTEAGNTPLRASTAWRAAEAASRPPLSAKAKPVPELVAFVPEESDDGLMIALPLQPQAGRHCRRCGRQPPLAAETEPGSAVGTRPSRSTAAPPRRCPWRGPGSRQSQRHG